MSNALFAYPDKTLSSALSTSGTAWEVSMPLTNLKNRLRSKVARTTGITTAHTKFDITLGSSQYVRMLAIISHNATMSATITLQFSNVTLGNSEAGLVSNASMYGSYFPADTPSHWSTGLASSYFTVKPDYWYVLPASTLVRYIRIEITDTGNPDGYFELGRCFVGNGLQTAINMDYGASIGWKQSVIKETSIGGVDWFEVLSQGREISGSFADMTMTEGLVMWYDRQRKLGQEGELYFIFDPADTVALAKQRAMLCRFAEEDLLKYPYFNASSGSFRLVEVR